MDSAAKGFHNSALRQFITDTSGQRFSKTQCRKNAILNISKSNQAMFHSTLHDNTTSDRLDWSLKWVSFLIPLRLEITCWDHTGLSTLNWIKSKGTCIGSLWHGVVKWCWNEQKSRSNKTCKINLTLFLNMFDVSKSNWKSESPSYVLVTVSTYFFVVVVTEASMSKNGSMCQHLQKSTTKSHQGDFFRFCEGTP